MLLLQKLNTNPKTKLKWHLRYISCGGRLTKVPAGTLRKPLQGCQWAWHNGTGYLLPPNTTVLMTNGPELNSTLSLFSVAISHTSGGNSGVAGSSGSGGRRLGDTIVASSSSGWVATVPGVPHPARMVGVAAGAAPAAPNGGGGNNVTVVANTEGIQAVWDAKQQQCLAVAWVPQVRHSVNLSWSSVMGLVAVEVDRSVPSRRGVPVSCFVGRLLLLVPKTRRLFRRGSIPRLSRRLGFLSLDTWALCSLNVGPVFIEHHVDRPVGIGGNSAVLPVFLLFGNFELWWWRDGC
jgi:hypothetical protein